MINYMAYWNWWKAEVETRKCCNFFSEVWKCNFFKWRRRKSEFRPSLISFFSQNQYTKSAFSKSIMRYSTKLIYSELAKYSLQMLIFYTNCPLIASSLNSFFSVSNKVQSGRINNKIRGSVGYLCVSGSESRWIHILSVW